VLFFWVILITGLYLFGFFHGSIDGAYESVEYITHEQWYIAGVMRSLHRYASDAAIITILLHMFKEFASGRYHGFRWFSWVSGLPILWLVVTIGITGYWLVWDELAQYVAIGSARLLDSLPIFSSSMASNFLQGEMTDRFFILS
jgi:quinol-cytochrome oxidoreductase complex cytochrome b subunit